MTEHRKTHQSEASIATPSHREAHSGQHNMTARKAHATKNSYSENTQNKEAAL
jgi:hypothetical protein